MDELLIHVVPFALALLRISGVFVFAPILASTAIPMRARVFLAFTITLAVFPAVPLASRSVVMGDVMTFAAAGLGEVLLGTMIGALALIPVSAVQLAGTLVGQQMGFALGSVFNPALETESDPLGELLLYLALGAFIAAGGLESLFVGVANTFAHVPLGGVGVSDMPGKMIVGMIGGGIELALRVSAPVLGIILIETIATSFLMKTIPQLNIMSIGFATKIILGMSAFVLAAAAIHRAISAHVDQGGGAMLKWSVGG